jgi:peptidyl-dipeptidase Dcp
MTLDAATIAAGQTDLPDDHPFAQPSSLPFHLPPFDRIDSGCYRSALLAGMAAQRREIEAITAAAGAVDFDGTVVALERSGRLLDRVYSVFQNLAQSDGDAAMLELEAQMAPLLAAHRDAIYLDEALFARIEALHRRRDQLALDEESQRLLERYYTAFVRAGVKLPAQQRSRLSAINQQLSVLRTQFRQNVLQATRAAALHVQRPGLLDGLSAAQLGAAAEAARARGLPDGWLLGLHNTTVQPLLAQLHERSLREQLYRASVGRARGGACDNRPVIAQLVQLRAERARLLGFDSHAAYVLADENAGNPEAVQRMLQQVAAAARAHAGHAAAQLQQLIDAEAAAAGRESFQLQPWDWPYYAERLRKAQYDFDSAEVRPYFELQRVLRDGLFRVAQALYGLQFRQRRDLPVYRDDVQVFEVADAGGNALALLLTDYYAHDDKQGGAWMSNFVTQSALLGQRPVVVNVLNIAPPAPGEPTLLTFEEVTTLFHEFGHALHGILADTKFPLLSGTSVPRDFVEYPSQFNEMWAREPAILQQFARHYRTGAALPPRLLQRIIAAQNLDQGYLMSEYLQAALLDQAWHGLAPGQTPGADAVDAFEAAALARTGLAAAPIPPRYYSTYFLHVFADEYPASYYAYLWSEVLARATGQWFHSHGGISRANGERLRSCVLARGGTRDTRAQFRDFYGAEPDVAPLLEYRGLAAPQSR